jgi:hypothetical protein
VQELCKSTGSSKSLKLVVPSVIGQYKPVYSVGLPDVPSSAEASDTAPSRKRLSDPTSGALQCARTSMSSQLWSSSTLYRHVT